MSKHNIPLPIEKRKSPEIIPNTIMSAAMFFFFFFCRGLTFDKAVVNEPSALLYCICQNNETYGSISCILYFSCVSAPFISTIVSNY